ncbi:NifB/NifX family molybdenum-iron cluster-binding protein [Shewanella mangrovi]|uniref:NifB/NifX family molybdenum-iron cluster-binding protein n=1 Tax=Shewanella mangrovi TaxID=1515746 RepID=UPI0006915EDD|nr:NifB/NifX family molybdenum-iron cluster-binding protein [Shewanella mangrovi]
MITAIPMSGDKIAGHFSKAETFLFINEQGTALAQEVNPGLSDGCAGKAQILALLQQQQVTRVIVRNIGERLLSRLLDAQFKVFQIGSSRWDSAEFLADAPRYLLPLTDASQGRPSVNYQRKQAEGGCGCEHDDQHACCQQQAHHAASEQGHVPCCQRRSAAARQHCCQH